MNDSDTAEFRSEKEIFFAALEQETPEARAGFLDGACTGDLELRRRVDKLLLDHFRIDSFMQSAAVDGTTGEVTAATMIEGPGSLIGRYKLLQKLGEGGFGVVYMAEQREPVKRRVALKIIKLGMDTKQVVARFEAERQALALMEHPNIAKVLDGGATDTGRPYFVMELVKGVPITRYCDDNNLSTRERLELFIPICQSIQHAHQKGIIHRDIKPSNVMITLHDGLPVPKVIDFGIAKATQQELTEKTLFTQYAQLIGTPAYMSPEQAEMSGLDIDTRTDIYSLGVLLYELLVGRTPLDVNELMSGGYDEIRKRIIEQEPSKPSTCLSTIEGKERTTIAKHRSIGPGQLGSELKGDLDWIVLRSLEKDRTRRYETANGFAADIRRFLNDEPVSAVAPSVTYKFRKLVRRNKLVFGAVAAIALALVLGLTAALVSYSRERAALAESETSRSVAVAARKEADDRRLDAVRLRKESELLSEDRRKETYRSDMILASQAYHSGNIDRMNALVEKHLTEPIPGQEDLRGFEWYHWWRAGRLAFKSINLHHSEGSFGGFQFSPGLPVYAVSLWPNMLAIQEATSEMNEQGRVRSDSQHAPFSFTPDGNTLIIGNHLSGGIQVLQGEDWSPQTFRAPGDDGIRALAFSQSRGLMATGGEGEHAVLWNSTTWKPVGSKIPVGGGVCGLAFSPDGKALLASMKNSTVVVWDVANPDNPSVQHTLKGHGKRVRCVATCPDAGFFATGSDDKTVRLWNANFEPTGTYDATGPVTVLKFSQDGTRLLVGTEDNNSVLVWKVQAEPPSLELVHDIKGHARAVVGVDFDPNSEEMDIMVSVSVEGKSRIWDLEKCEPYLSLNLIPDAMRICYGKGGRALLIADREGKVHRWDLRSRELVPHSPQPDDFQTLALSKEGGVHAGISQGGFVAVWDSDTGTIQESSKTVPDLDKVFQAISKDGTTKAWQMVLSGDGSTVAWMTEEGGHVWNWRKKEMKHVPLGEESLLTVFGALHLPTLSFNGESLVVHGSEDHHFSTLWDTTAAPPKTVWPRRVNGWGPERSGAFSRDGKHLAIGSFSTNVRLYDTHDTDLDDDPRLLKAHSTSIRGLAFSNDGTRLASDDVDGKLCIWDVKSGGLITTLQGNEGLSGTLIWSQNGDSIASLSSSGKVRVWITATRDEVASDLEKIQSQ